MHFCPRGAVRKSRYIAWSLSAIPWKTGSSKLLAAIALCRRSCRKARLRHGTFRHPCSSVFHVKSGRLLYGYCPSDDIHSPFAETVHWGLSCCSNKIEGLTSPHEPVLKAALILVRFPFSKRGVSVCMSNIPAEAKKRAGWKILSLCPLLNES